MGKKLNKHATIVRHFSIVVCIAQLVGCPSPRVLPERRFQQAQELVDVGTRFLRKRSFDEARKAFELASELAPLAAAIDGLGCVALVEGRYDSAEEYFVEAYEMDRAYDEALVNLGLALELQGKPEEAVAVYMKYLHKNPSSALVRNNLAALEYDRGMRTMEAAKSLEKALVLSDQGVIRDNLAILKGK